MSQERTLTTVTRDYREGYAEALETLTTAATPETLHEAMAVLDAATAKVPHDSRLASRYLGARAAVLDLLNREEGTT